MQTDTDAQRRTAGAVHLRGVGAHGRLHRQGGVTGPQGVIFMGQRDAEQGHHAVAQYLVDGTAVALHGVRHGAQDGLQELLNAFGIQVTNECQRTTDVGKEDGHLLTLAARRLTLPGRRQRAR